VITSGHTANVEAAVARVAGAAGHTVDLRDEISMARFFDGLCTIDHRAVTAGDRDGWRGMMFTATPELELAPARARVSERTLFQLSLSAFGRPCRLAPGPTLSTCTVQNMFG
jgi:hypothetical protein